MSEELKPCPFCGDVPELPSGDGTQYEIECGGCGQAMASVQICDLMTPEERTADSFTDYRYAEQFVERAKQQAITNWNRRAQPAEAEGVADLKPILEAVEREYEMGGLSDGLYADYASDVAKRYASDALSAVTAERDRLAEQASKFRLVERAMEALACDEREGGIVTAASLILISSAHRMNAKRGVIDQEGVTLDDDCIGDWRVTIERISPAMAAKEA